jgi:hypothetical protein
LNIGIIDADLLDGGTRFPNLALMKISGYEKEKGNYVKLLTNYDDINQYDTVYISKVFDFTKTPGITQHHNVVYGGTGYFYDKAPPLSEEIEHHKPDYTLYDEFVNNAIADGQSEKNFIYYTDASIGFTTRGCFRKCPFCVNQHYDRVQPYSPVSEFLDLDRKIITLLDDNILGYSGWREIIEQVKDTGKQFEFKQGMDIRLMTEEKAKVLSDCRYHGDYIFAFDYIKDAHLIRQKLEIWRNYTDKNTKLYVLVAYESQGIRDIVNTFKRIGILMEFGCLPYIMRYKDYKDSEMYGMYTNIASWCNQPSFFKKMTFREFCIERGKGLKSGNPGSSWRYMEEFEKKYPDEAETYFDRRFEQMKRM